VCGVAAKAAFARMSGGWDAPTDAGAMGWCVRGHGIMRTRGVRDHEGGGDHRQDGVSRDVATDEP
jgi:hypothetical protein